MTKKLWWPTSFALVSQMLFISNGLANWSFDLTSRYLPRAFTSFNDYGDPSDYNLPPFGIAVEYRYGPAMARFDGLGSFGLGYLPTPNLAFVGEYFFTFGPRMALLAAYQINLTGLEPDIFVKPRLGLIHSTRAAGNVVDVYTGVNVGFQWGSGKESQAKGTNWLAYGLIGGLLVWTVVGSIYAMNELYE
jgi:hypothetical protein